jgi:predicted alpha/beta hydrolase family esterase
MSRVLIVPGWNGSGPDHWQSHWQQRHPEYQRVEQRDWLDVSVQEYTGLKPDSNIDCGSRVTALHTAIVSDGEPVVLAAHSLGCLTIAWWAHLFPECAGLVSVALLVAPPDLECASETPAPLRDFPPAPRVALPFPSVFVGSENDPYMTLSAAASLARDWECYFINAGAAGHINPASGFGTWPRGERLLDQLVHWSDSRHEPERAA